MCRNIRKVMVFDQYFLLYRMEANNSHPTRMLPLNAVKGSSGTQAKAALKLRYFTTIPWWLLKTARQQTSHTWHVNFCWAWEEQFMIPLSCPWRSAQLAATFSELRSTKCTQTDAWLPLIVMLFASSKLKTAFDHLRGFVFLTKPLDSNKTKGYSV